MSNYENRRLLLFFCAVYLLLVLCIAAILVAHSRSEARTAAALRGTAAALRGIRDLAEKSDRNNQTAWAAYDAAEHGRQQLGRMVREEKRMNKTLIRMGREDLANEARIQRQLRALERRGR